MRLVDRFAADQLGGPGEHAAQEKYSGGQPRLEPPATGYGLIRWQSYTTAEAVYVEQQPEESRSYWRRQYRR